jgi:hypothetical protein
MDAIKILSFRVPQTSGAGLACGAGPARRCWGRHALGGDDGALLQQWLQRFFGQGLNQAGAPPMGMPNFGAGPSMAQPGLDGGAQGRTTVQFVTPPPPSPEPPTWGDIGGAQRSMGPPAYTPSLGPMGGGFNTPSTPENQY